MPRVLIGNIKGPTGATGATGPKGATGATGPQGPLPPLVNNYLTTQAGVAAADAALMADIDKRLTQQYSDLGVTYKEYSSALLNGRITVRRVANQIYIDANTTAKSYLNGAIPHGLAVLDGNYIALEGIVVVPVNNGGSTAYVNVSNDGALLMTLSNPIDVGGAICIHAVFPAK